MSIEADFTPPSVSGEAANGPKDATFPLSTSLKIVFSAYEDRLVVHSRRVNREPVNVLLTRRMTIIVLAQLLANLPELSGLDKTPMQYWQEVLQMVHQTALASGRAAQDEENDETQEVSASVPAAGETGASGDHAEAASSEGEPDEPESEQPESSAARPGKLEGDIYLATSLTLMPQEGQLILAFTGLPMPCAMTEPCEREPLFAIPLQVEHVHQLIQLLIDRAQEADWHLPLNLPWLESPADPPATTLGLMH